MFFRRAATILTGLSLSLAALAQTSGTSSSADSAKPARNPPAAESALDPGTVTNNIYRNKTLALSCRIPLGWVLRTEEMNAPEPKQEEAQSTKADSAPAPASSTASRVLLAAFSRPPEARAEDVNSSVLIAAEPTASYPGLKDAAQYFGPLTEVAKAQGFSIDEDPYDFAVGTKNLVRGDFHKDVGTRVMRQSTLAMLSHGYAISITVIAGTDDDVEELIDGLSFTPTGK